VQWRDHAFAVLKADLGVDTVAVTAALYDRSFAAWRAT
jgi:hypothetical protein